MCRILPSRLSTLEVVDIIDVILESGLSSGIPSKFGVGKTSSYNNDTSVGAILIDSAYHLIDIVCVSVRIHTASVIHTESDNNEIGILAADFGKLADAAIGIRSADTYVLLCNVYVVCVLDVLFNENVVLRTVRRHINTVLTRSRPTVSDTVTCCNDLYILAGIELVNKSSESCALCFRNIYNALFFLGVHISYCDRPLRHTGLVIADLCADKAPTEVISLGKLGSKLVLIMLILREREVIVVICENGNISAFNYAKISVIVNKIVFSGNIYGLEVSTAYGDQGVNRIEKLNRSNYAIFLLSYKSSFCIADVTRPDRIEELIEIESRNVVLVGFRSFGLGLLSGLFGRLVGLLIRRLIGRFIGRILTVCFLVRRCIYTTLIFCITAEERKRQSEDNSNAK